MSLPPFLRRQASHAIGKPGRSSEKRLHREMKKDGARLRPASGAVEGIKGDIEKGDFLIEAKSTTRSSISLKLEWLVKIKQEARREGKQPALIVSFIAPDGKAYRDGEWVCVPRTEWEKIT